MQPYKVWAVQDLIEKNKRVFKRPVSQRTDDGTNVQCEKLYSDILEAFDNDKKHFLGTIVYIKGQIDSSQLEEALIIDGQQRITTIYLLMKALYDYANKNEIVQLKEELSEYLFNRRCEEQYKIKLKPIKADNEQLYLLMNDGNDELLNSSNIVRNYKLFINLIEDSVERGYLPRDILQGMKKLEMVEIILDKSQGDEPQMIFESINSTGLELSLADLIRNYLLMDDDNQDELFEKYWLKIEKMIGYDELREFFIQFLNCKLTEKVSSKNAYIKFKKYYKDNYTNHENILKELKKYAQYYSAFIGRNNVYSDEVSQYLLDFKAMNQSTIYPFLFLVFEDYEKNIINEETVINVLKLLRSYSIRRIICEVPSNSLRGFYKSLYSRIFKNEQDKQKYYENIFIFFKSIKTKDKLINNNEFKESLIHKQLYKKSICKYLLSSIENSGKEKINVSNMSIEHILPQKENSIVWKEEIGENYRRVYETYLHTLGNLTITGLNSELGAKPFIDKKEIIKENSKANILNEMVLNVDQWNERTILNRAKSLADKVIDIFDFDEVNVCVEEDNNEEVYDLESLIDVANTKPSCFIFCGEVVNVKNYSEMLTKFIELLYDLQPRLIEKLANDKFKPTQSNRVYLSFDNSDMRRYREIGRTGIYFEINLSASSILYFIKQLITLSDFEINDFEYILR